MTVATPPPVIFDVVQIATVRRTDVVLGVVVFALSGFVGVQVRSGAFIVATTAAPPVVVALVLLQASALIFRRAAPLAVLGAVFAAEVAIKFAGDRSGLNLAAVVAVVTAGWFVSPALSLPAALLGGICVAAAVEATATDPSVGHAVWTVGVTLVLWAVGWVGFFVRRRTARARALATDEAIRGERARIARELHDVVAHHVTVMVLQAGAGRMALSQNPEAARGPLEDIERTGHSALTELRRLLFLLKAGDREGVIDHHPQPGMAALSELVEQMRGTGVSVGFEVRGEQRPLDAGVELSAYRIVQESLTNTLRHAGRVPMSVVVEYGTECLRLKVCDEATTRRPASTGAVGHGIAGMRERAALLGGEVTARPRPEGGFVVEAILQYAGPRP